MVLVVSVGQPARFLDAQAARRSHPHAQQHLPRLRLHVLLHAAHHTSQKHGLCDSTAGCVRASIVNAMGRVVGALARRLPRIHAITGTARRLPLSKRGNFGDILATRQECVAGGFLPRARLQDGRQLR